MIELRWPFRSRHHALAHEAAYLRGTYHPKGAKAIELVTQEDLVRERWLERHMGERRESGELDQKAINTIYLWKMAAVLNYAKVPVVVPAALQTVDFGGTMTAVLSAENPGQSLAALSDLLRYQGVGVPVASAFMYWAKPAAFQLIDIRVAQALNLPFDPRERDECPPETYLEFCEASHGLAREYDLSARQLDRALFVYHKLLDKGAFIPAP